MTDSTFIYMWSTAEMSPFRPGKPNRCFFSIFAFLQCPASSALYKAMQGGYYAVVVTDLTVYTPYGIRA